MVRGNNDFHVWLSILLPFLLYFKIVAVKSGSHESAQSPAPQITYTDTNNGTKAAAYSSKTADEVVSSDPSSISAKHSFYELIDNSSEIFRDRLSTSTTSGYGFSFETTVNVLSYGTSQDNPNKEEVSSELFFPMTRISELSGRLTDRNAFKSTHFLSTFNSLTPLQNKNTTPSVNPNLTQSRSDLESQLTEPSDFKKKIFNLKVENTTDKIWNLTKFSVDTTKNNSYSKFNSNLNSSETSENYFDEPVTTISESVQNIEIPETAVEFSNNLTTLVMSLILARSSKTMPNENSIYFYDTDTIPALSYSSFSVISPNNKLSIDVKNHNEQYFSKTPNEVNSAEKANEQWTRPSVNTTTTARPLDTLVAPGKNLEIDWWNNYYHNSLSVSSEKPGNDISGSKLEAEIPTTGITAVTSYGMSTKTNGFKGIDRNHIGPRGSKNYVNNVVAGCAINTAKSSGNLPLIHDIVKSSSLDNIATEDRPTVSMTTPLHYSDNVTPSSVQKDALSFLVAWKAKIDQLTSTPSSLSKYTSAHWNNPTRDEERIFWFWKPTTTRYTTTTTTIRPSSTLPASYDSTDEDDYITSPLPETTSTPTYATPTYKVYWNVPTFQCHKYGMNFSSVSQWGLEQNFLDEFRGEAIAILYDPGEFPALLSGPGEHRISRNGGVPQEASLTRHLSLFKTHLEKLIPDIQFSGLGVIDFEHWRPVWRQNWGSLFVYKEYSRDLEKRRHPHWFSSMIEKEAKFKYELAARTFLLETLRLAKQLRPEARWGYYGYPFCYNYTPNNNRPTCSRETAAENDAMWWLFSEVTAHYPSLYLKEKDMYSWKRRRFVEGRLDESMRVAQDVPVYPYVWYKYHDTRRFLPEADMRELLRRPMLRGCSGVVIWGASRDVNTREKCLELENYLESVIGPLVLELHSGLRLGTDEDTSTFRYEEEQEEEIEGEEDEDEEEEEEEMRNNIRKIV